MGLAPLVSPGRGVEIVSERGKKNSIAGTEGQGVTEKGIEEDRDDVVELTPAGMMTHREYVREAYSAAEDEILEKEMEYGIELADAYNKLDRDDALASFPVLEDVYRFEDRSREYARETLDSEQAVRQFNRMTADYISAGVKSGDIWDRFEEMKSRDREVER